MDEFQLIEKYFAPLAKDFSGAYGLKDDAATLTPSPGYDIVLTKDALVAGVHFFADDKPQDIALKLLGVNASDLASMGAYPRAYLLAAIFPKNTKEEWIANFAKGLAEACKKFGGHIVGGDTVSHNGALTLTLTAVGEVPTGKALKRSGAKVGDGIYVSGTIGDSYLGLQILSGKLDFKSDYLLDRYLHPQARVNLGMELVGIANACTDISDGLIADLGHICECSNVGATIHSDKIPLSTDAKNSAVAIEKLVTGGDDYELIFTLPDDATPPEGTTCIGEITAGKGVKLLDADGKAISLEKTGYSHF